MKMAAEFPDNNVQFSAGFKEFYSVTGGTGDPGLPSITDEDDGKILQAVDKTWQAVSIPESSAGAYVDQKVAEQNQKLTAQDQKIAEQNQKLTAQDQKVAGQEQRLDTQEQRLDTQGQQLNEQGQQTAALADKIAALEQQLDEHVNPYVNIAISNQSHGKGTQEKGVVINQVTVTWLVNRDPQTLTISGPGITGEEALSVTARSRTVSGLNIHADNSGSFKWTIKATGEKGESSAKTTGNFTFLNCVYYGAAAQPPAVDSDFIKAFAQIGTKTSPTSTKARTITVNGGGNHIWYCLPVSLGKCTFKSNGFPAGIELVNNGNDGVVSFKNDLGYTENYYVYRSNQKITDTMTIEVS